MDDTENQPTSQKTTSRPRSNRKSASNKASSRQTQNFLIVGIGASAGGVEALEQFFSGLPGNNLGMAFIVITHLSPEYESNLDKIIQNNTSLQVIQVNEPVPVEPNVVYVIPPGRQLAMNDGHIRLTELEQVRIKRAPIDLLFRTLAEAHTDWAAAVVLSGTGTDGAIGLPRIKEMGGLTISQDPDEAQYNQMPKSAIATGFVDHIMPVAGMGEWLVRYLESRRNVQLPSVVNNGSEDEDDNDQVVTPARGDILLEILALLRVRTGHNFALYKRSTLNRRIERRMQVNDLPDLVSYYNFLNNHPTEVQALLRDLLISVTNFFRDKDVWEYMETNVIPTLFQDKERSDGVIRVWVAGCATGEEAYSLAILLHEYASHLTHFPKIQVFGTDLDEHAIAVAREGSYPETIGLDVSPERLRQYFTHNGRRYRVRKEVRETVLFASHDLLKDPPFSRLDLVSCRNLLIYLNKDAQEQLLNLFHFSLKPEGFLLLGTSESAEGLSLLYSSFDKKNHLYTRRTVPRFSQPVPALPTAEHTRSIEVVRFPSVPPVPIKDKTIFPNDLHQNVLELYAPPSVIIDENFEIIHLSNSAGRYLQFSGGEPYINLMRLVHPDLRLDLRSGLYNAVQRNKANETRRLRVHLDGADRLVRLIIRPVQDPPSLRGYVMVIFDEIEESAEEEEIILSDDQDNSERKQVSSTDNVFTRQLEEEIEVLKSQLRTTIEQYETSVEELKASNEELQAINEELRSATEELETSKEEMQAVNEELMTVNQELKIKIDEVSHANSDLQNLMVSTDIATMFLNRQMRVKRYTPRIERLFNIIPTDLERPLAHLTHRLEYNDLLDDAESVLRDLTPIVREIKTVDDEWYMVRLLPYRTLEDRIDGVVLTFMDITERKLAEVALREREDRYRILFTSIDEAFALCEIILDGDRKAVDYRLLELNPAFEKMTGISQEQAQAKTIRQLLPELEKRYFEIYGQVVQTGQSIRFENYLAALGKWFDTFASNLGDNQFVTIFTDITERKQSEEKLAYQAYLLEVAREGVIASDNQGRITFWNAGATQIYGWTSSEVLGKPLSEIIKAVNTGNGKSPQPGNAPESELGQTENALNETLVYRKDKSQAWVEFGTSPYYDRDGQIAGYVSVHRDIAARKETDRVLRESEERFRMVADLVPDLLWRSDNQANISWVNHRWTEFTGQTNEEAQGRGWLEVVHPDDREQSLAAFQEAFASGQPIQREHRMLSRDGVYRWFLVQAQPFYDDQGQIFQWFGAATDMEEQRQVQTSLEERVRIRTSELTQANNSLHSERQRLAELSTRLMEVQETERRHLARELHDEIGQYLTGLKFLLESNKVQLFSDNSEQLHNVLAIVDDLTLRVRELSLSLRPSILDDMGLLPAILWHIQRYTEQTSIQVDFRHMGLDKRLPGLLETAIYRLIQEALTNVARHAGVPEVTVQILSDSIVTVIIEDRGKGFDPEKVLAAHTSSGVSGMLERVELAGGQLTIDSTPGHGTTLIAEIPLDNKPGDNKSDEATRSDE